MNPENAPPMHRIACLVEDRPGALFRISGMFSSRGFNIESLNVEKTRRAHVSRIVLVCKGDNRGVSQIVSQLNKLVEVIEAAEFPLGATNIEAVFDPVLEEKPVRILSDAGASNPTGEKMTGADMIPRVLAQEGVDTVFGYSGGAILPAIDALFRYNAEHADKPIRFIVPANEQGAGFMASGYARSSGRVGVALVTSGPGATNTVTPIRDAMADSIPLVCITGQVPRASIGTDAFQEAPILNIMSGCAKHVFLVEEPEELEATLRTAFEIARTGRPGPVVVDIPKDVQLWMGPFQGSVRLPLPGYRRRAERLAASRLSKADCETFYKKLGECERPLLYVGGGVINSNAAGELQAFADAHGIPVVTTLMGIGSLDNQHALSMHMLGMHGTAYANYAVEACDFLFAVGARFDDRVAGKVQEFAPHSKFVAHLDADASEIGKVKAVQWSHVADAKQGMKDLIAGGKTLGFSKRFDAWAKEAAELKRKYPLAYKREGPHIQPQAVLELLNESLQGEAMITTGVGQHQMWAAQYLRHRFPRRWLTSGSMGTMGFGLPAAIGAQFAFPDRTVIDIDGDGSLRMNLGELETIATHGLNVKVLLLHNDGDGMVRQWQTMYYDKRYFAIDKNLHTLDFVQMAQSAGFPFARGVREPGGLRDAVRDFLGCKGPAFLEVRIDPYAAVYPIVGPGKGYRDMITGPWIPAKDAAPPSRPDEAVPEALF